MLFENDTLVVCEDFDGIVDVNVECVAKLFGDDDSSEFINLSYNSCGFHGAYSSNLTVTLLSLPEWSRDSFSALDCRC